MDYEAGQANIAHEANDHIQTLSGNSEQPSMVSLIIRSRVKIIVRRSAAWQPKPSDLYPLFRHRTVRTSKQRNPKPNPKHLPLGRATVTVRHPKDPPYRNI